MLGVFFTGPECPLPFVLVILDADVDVAPREVVNEALQQDRGVTSNPVPWGEPVAVPKEQ